jgi:hypothetical protein
MIENLAKLWNWKEEHCKTYQINENEKIWI